MTAARSAGAFTRHMREAIELNRARLPLYAALTGGRSVPISRMLIRSERLATPAALFVDWRARPFQNAGVRVVEDDFAPMRTVPEFRDTFPAPVLTEYRPGNAGHLKRRLRSAWRSDDFAGLRHAADVEIERLAAQPCFHCMQRHMLESLRRIAHLAPRHAAAACAAGLGSTRPLSRLLVRLHLWGLPSCARLDDRAAPLQAAGIPILYQDLPPIPMEP